MARWIDGWMNEWSIGVFDARFKGRDCVRCKAAKAVPATVNNEAFRFPFVNVWRWRARSAWGEACRITAST